MFDPRLISALHEQLEGRREALRRDAQHVGWKLGRGERERIGTGPVVGFLTSASQLPRGGSYRAALGSSLHADVEVALELGEDGQVAGFGAALEFVDLAGSASAEEIVATNVFHRAVIFGPFGPTTPPGYAVRRSSTARSVRTRRFRTTTGLASLTRWRGCSAPSASACCPAIG